MLANAASDGFTCERIVQFMHFTVLANMDALACLHDIDRAVRNMTVDKQNPLNLATTPASRLVDKRSVKTGSC